MFNQIKKREKIPLGNKICDYSVAVSPNKA